MRAHVIDTLRAGRRLSVGWLVLGTTATAAEPTLGAAARFLLLREGSADTVRASCAHTGQTLWRNAAPSAAEAAEAQACLVAEKNGVQDAAWRAGRSEAEVRSRVALVTQPLRVGRSGVLVPVGPELEAQVRLETRPTTTPSLWPYAVGWGVSGASILAAVVLLPLASHQADLNDERERNRAYGNAELESGVRRENTLRAAGGTMLGLGLAGLAVTTTLYFVTGPGGTKVTVSTLGAPGALGLSMFGKF